jgi:hypothetical protein
MIQQDMDLLVGGSKAQSNQHNFLYNKWKEEIN